MATMEQSQVVRGGHADCHLYFGIALVALGALLLVDRMAIVDVRISYWPFFVLAFAFIKLLNPPSTEQGARSRRGAMWLLLIGCWGIVSEFHLFGLDYDTSWPLMVVAAGLMMVWRWYEGPDACGLPREH